MSDTHTYVIVTDYANTYLVGENTTPPEEVLSSDTVYLRRAVRMTIAPNPEDPSQQRIHINPIMVCDEISVRVDKFIGIGILKDDLLSRYQSWQQSYDSHDELFNEVSDAEMAKESPEKNRGP